MIKFNFNDIFKDVFFILSLPKTLNHNFTITGRWQNLNHELTLHSLDNTNNTQLNIISSVFKLWIGKVLRNLI